MSNRYHYESGELGPFWITIQDNDYDQLQVRIVRGEWDVVNPFFYPLSTNLDFIRAKCRMICRGILRKEAVEVDNYICSKEFT